MSKVKIYSVNKKERTRIANDLLFVISDLKSKNDITDFFLGILTQSEILMIARRLQIAKFLLDNEGYDEISKKMHVSHQTINRTEQWVRYNLDAKNSITSKIKAINSNKEFEIDKGYNMLDKYAHHKILKDLLGL